MKCFHCSINPGQYLYLLQSSSYRESIKAGLGGGGNTEVSATPTQQVAAADATTASYNKGCETTRAGPAQQGNISSAKLVSQASETAENHSNQNMKSRATVTAGCVAAHPQRIAAA